MRNLSCKWNFRANFGGLSLGFDVKALISQGLFGRPNYFGLLNNSMTLIICEILRQIGKMACVTSAWSSRGQTLKHGAILYNEAEVFSLSITNPNGWPMLPFDWLIPLGLILASCHRILFLCRFSAVEK